MAREDLAWSFSTASTRAPATRARRRWARASACPRPHLRIHAYGTVDETNATVGMARLHTSDADFAKLDAMLARIQNDLFDLGADLCVPDTGKDLGYEPLRMTRAQTERLEAEIDELNAELAAAALLRAAGRPSGRGLSPSLPHRLPARRAPDGRAQPRSGQERVSDRRAHFHQPAVRFLLRREPLGECAEARATCSGSREPTADVRAAS